MRPAVRPYGIAVVETAGGPTFQRDIGFGCPETFTWTGVIFWLPFSTGHRPLSYVELGSFKYYFYIRRRCVFRRTDFESIWRVRPVRPSVTSIRYYYYHSYYFFVAKNKRNLLYKYRTFYALPIRNTTRCRVRHRRKDGVFHGVHQPCFFYRYLKHLNA